MGKRYFKENKENMEMLIRGAYAILAKIIIYDNFRKLCDSSYREENRNHTIV